MQIWREEGKRVTTSRSVTVFFQLSAQRLDHSGPNSARIKPGVWSAEHALQSVELSPNSYKVYFIKRSWNCELRSDLLLFFVCLFVWNTPTSAQGSLLHLLSEIILSVLRELYDLQGTEFVSAMPKTSTLPSIHQHYASFFFFLISEYFLLPKKMILG